MASDQVRISIARTAARKKLLQGHAVESGPPRPSAARRLVCRFRPSSANPASVADCHSGRPHSSLGFVTQATLPISLLLHTIVRCPTTHLLAGSRSPFCT